MKVISLLLALIFCADSIAGLPPTSLKGQADTSAATTFFFQTPNSQATPVSGSTGLLETGNNNILSNPSFEHTTFSTGWTLTAGSASVEPTKVKHGAKAYRVTLSAETLELYQDSTRYASNFNGANLDRSAWVATTLSNSIFVCPRVDGAAVYSACATVDSSGNYAPYNAAYPAGSTSNGIVIVSGTISGGVVTPGAVTGDVYIDGEVYVGESKSITTTPIITPWQSYTPTYTGFGTVSSNSARWRQVGSSIEVEATFTAGTISATLASITLPNGYTLNSSAIPIANTTANPGHMVGGWSVPGASNRGDLVTATGTSTSLIYFAINYTSAAHLTPTNGSSVGVSSTHTSLYFKVPIANLSGSTQVFASQCGAACREYFTPTVSSTGVISGDDQSILSSCTWSPTGTLTCGFNSGVFTVPPRCFADAEFTAWQASTTASQVVISARNSLGAGSNTDIGLLCFKKGADLINARTLQGSFKEVVTAPGITRPKTCKFYYSGAASTTTSCTSSPCTEREDTCGAVSACTRSGTGQYACVVASGTFAPNSYIDCRAMTNSFDIRVLPLVVDSSGGLTLDIFSASSGAVNTDTYGRVTCEGQAP